ncbi:uncharacterized protein LOC128386245 [Panonychus citri]|uniref:uncharacterized protein LOC128386245 n=1 Tax=Panonychus citri TaxID=50023 RepID=UPI002307F6AB|nr:uncharacterized protein LOC128386245 [Panonychus citri]
MIRIDFSFSPSFNRSTLMMKLITIGFILIGSIFSTSSNYFNFKQLADYGLISENNYWCQIYNDCNVLPYKVCLIVGNQTKSVIPLINDNLTDHDGQSTLWKCKCCVVKGTNILILRSLWFEAIKQLNELNYNSKDKDNPMLTITVSSTESSSSSTEQSRSTNYDSVSIEIINSDNSDLLINTTSSKFFQFNLSTDLQSTITEETDQLDSITTEPSDDPDKIIAGKL